MVLTLFLAVYYSLSKKVALSSIILNDLLQFFSFFIFGIAINSVGRYMTRVTKSL